MMKTFENRCVLKIYVIVLRPIFDIMYKEKNRSKYTCDIYITNWSYSNKVGIFRYLLENDMEGDILGWTMLETALGEAQSVTSTKDARQMGRITQTGAWMSVLLSTVNGTALGYQEWGGSLFLLYAIDLPDVPDHCNGCGASFDKFHALD